jgi:hypothetical protein
MTIPADPRDPPLAEPGKRPFGADVGGMRATAEPGVAEAAQRSSERGDRPAPDERPTPAADPKRGPPSAPARAGSNADDGDEDEWRHEPVAPVDERNPLKSLGEAVADTLTGGDIDTTRPPKR